MSFLFTGLPAHFWLIIVYVVMAALVVAGVIPQEAVTGLPEGAAATNGQIIEATFNKAPNIDLPLFGATLAISYTTIFVALGFLTQWIEAIRATRIRKTGGNDLLSVLIAFAALLAFAGVDYFQTTAFLVIVIVGFGDILLDRIIGQAVARRDFGGIGLGVGGDG